MEYASFGFALVSAFITVAAFVFANNIPRWARIFFGLVGIIGVIFFGLAGLRSLQDKPREQEPPKTLPTPSATNVVFPRLTAEIVEAPSELRTDFCSAPIYKDDFSDTKSGWAKSFRNSVTGSNNGYGPSNTYYFESLTVNTPIWEVFVPTEFDFADTTVTVKASASRGDGHMGLLIGLTGDYNDLNLTEHLLITLETGGAIRIEQRKSGATNTLAKIATQSVRSKTTDSFQLNAEFIGSQLVINLNGEEVTRVNVENPSRGRIGMFAEALESFPFYVSFDDIYICSRQG